MINSADQALYQFFRVNRADENHVRLDLNNMNLCFVFMMSKAQKASWIK